MVTSKSIAASVLLAAAVSAQPLQFNRDIRPVLSDKCLRCHGQDAASKGIGLRLDREETAKADLGGRRAIVPGKPEESGVVQRLRTSNKALRMPPAHTGATVSEAEIALLERWIGEGARWQKHWSFLPPEKAAVPAGQNAIDYFVRQRLVKEGLRPSSGADRRTLIRRVSFDVTGLPPAPEETEAFVNDASPGAYEKLVDRLLASPGYAERMAIRWLDASRYADTNGYQTDADRIMWRWRDWVVDAFQKNMPFDRFAVEQIAGDLLPGATVAQQIATGFSRNHRGNSEGGIVPEEYLLEYAADRSETMSTVFLGLTVGCARCHNHKYDPITQKEYYQLLGYFNNIGEPGRYLKYGNSPPMVAAPTAEQDGKLRELRAAVAEAGRSFTAMEPAIAAAQAKWEKTVAADAEWRSREKLDAELLPAPVAFDGKKVFEAGDHAQYGFQDRFSLSFRMKTSTGNGVILHRMGSDESNPGGYGLHLENGKLQVQLAVRRLDDGILLESKQAVARDRWVHVAVTYDGSRYASGVAVYVDGAPLEMNVQLDALNQDFRRAGKLVFGGGGGWEQKFAGEIAEFRAYSRLLRAEDVAMLALPERLGQVARTAEGRRGAIHRQYLRQAFYELGADTAVKAARARVAATAAALEAFEQTIPTVMVMRERPVPADTFVLMRGAYDKPGEKVERGVPAALHGLPAGAGKDRLGLANWLVDRQNPLTARVTVNRMWQMAFGVGLVKTVEDFGSQGDWPSHPELLDWLAVDFMENGWDLKRLWKAILMSETYRQSSVATSEQRERDPENRLLARGPRFRLPAEMVRDQALRAAGLLVEKQGGPPVKPYQPAGLWSENGGADYKPDRGESLYRRSLYTFWRRTSPPPFMATFDSALRESCTVREGRTNTPLQALHLMNDVQFLEAARALAQRAILEAGPDTARRLDRTFELVLARRPREAEAAAMRSMLAYAQDRFRTRPKDAEALLAQGESARERSIDVVDHAAWTTVASMVLNLDAAVTKE
jgi:cytochrome c553